MNLGGGVLRKFGADFFCVFSGFHLPDKRNVQTGFLRRFFGAQIFPPILAPIFAPIFGAQIFAPIFKQIFRVLCADFCAHFRAHFPQIFLRRFGA